MEQRYFEYIMTNDRQTVLYTGVTGNLARRVFEHRTHAIPGFSTRYNVGKLVFYQEFPDPAAAIAREKQLKGWRREKKLALIGKTNAAWVDLSRDWYDLEPADYRRALDRMDA